VTEPLEDFDEPTLESIRVEVRAENNPRSARSKRVPEQFIYNILSVSQAGLFGMLFRQL